MKTDRELLEQALKLVSKYHARETILVDWEKSVIEAIKARIEAIKARKLTDAEIDDVISKQRFFYGADANAYTFARAIERRISGEE